MSLSVVGNKCHALHISTFCPRKGCVPGSHVLLLILLSAIITFCLNLIVHALIGGEWKSDGNCSLFNTPCQLGDFVMSQFLRLCLIWFNMSKGNLTFTMNLFFPFRKIEPGRGDISSSLKEQETWWRKWIVVINVRKIIEIFQIEESCVVNAWNACEDHNLG